MEHTDILGSLYRVCGRLLVTKSWKVSVFGISAASDDPTIHPSHFCHACKLVIHKCKTGYHHRTTAFEGWCVHKEENCTVCDHYTTLKNPGRRKKTKHTPGWPSKTRAQQCSDWVQNIAPKPLISPDTAINICTLHLHLPVSEFHCPICCDILRQPVELVTCGRIVCAQCVCRWLHHLTEPTCPCCYTDHLEDVIDNWNRLHTHFTNSLMLFLRYIEIT